MMRLPPFRHYRPRTVEEALAIMDGEGPEAAFLAGGTDLLPNMKRRQQTPRVLVGLSGIAELRGVRGDSRTGLRLGPMTTLAELVRDPAVRAAWPAVARTAELISTPPLRNMGTIGGNLLIDTRCNYYNQSYEWRRAIDFCMKKDGRVCWVAPSSPRCWAVQSSDEVPLMCVLGATLRLLSPDGSERTVEAAELYADDGIAHLRKRPEELLVEIALPPVEGRRATYLKLRRRGSFDFPVLGVAAALQLEGELVMSARIAIGGVGSAPRSSPEAEAFLRGRSLADEETIARAAELAARPARPLDNTDFHMSWRKKMTSVFVARALRELRAGVAATALV
ncbi:MAG: molybdopterin dehydrogenase [Planctomycetota bacterium]|nr:MAG: molybdopterin dehydrogenase [Planctomycetota bacterium]